MRTLYFLFILAFSSSVTYAKGGPNPLLAAGSPGVERCNEVAVIAKRISENTNAVSGRPSRRMAMDAMRCSAAETKAQEVAQKSMFQKFLDIFH